MKTKNSFFGLLGFGRGAISDTPVFPVSLSSEPVLIETKRKKTSGIQVAPFFTDRTNIGEYKYVSTEGFLILNPTIIRLTWLPTDSAGSSYGSLLLDGWNV